MAKVVYLLMTVVGATAGAAAALLGAWAWQRHRRRLRAARASYPQPRMSARAAPPLLALRPAIGRPSEVHLHLHGASAENVAAILASPDGCRS